MKNTDHESIGNIVNPLAHGESAKWSYISLGFSLFYFFPILAHEGRLSVLDIAIIVSIYVVFLGCFFVSTQRSGRHAVFPISGIIIISAVGAYCYPGTGALFGFAAFFSGYYFPMRKALMLLCVNLATQLIVATSFNLLVYYFLGVSAFTTVSLFVYGAFSRKDTLHGIAKAKQNQYIEQIAAIAERERIARDMHDLLGHSLSTLALKSELAEKLIIKGKTDAAQKEIKDVAHVARQTLSEVREAVTGLKKQSLHTVINELTDELTKLGYQTQKTIDIPPLNAKTESTLLMLCKEWVTNILRHSAGDKVALSIAQQAGEISLTIKDNGTVDKIQPGNGINGMKSRVAELKGKLSIDTQTGVMLTVTLPQQAIE